MIYHVTGTMGAGKSAALLDSLEILKGMNRKVLVLTTEDIGVVNSRDGRSVPAQKVTPEVLELIPRGFKSKLKDWILVDEAQWLTQGQVRDLINTGHTIIFYGVDYPTEANDYLKSLRTVSRSVLTGNCGFCEKTAIKNIRTDEMSPLAKNGYAPVCSDHLHLEVK